MQQGVRADENIRFARRRALLCQPLFFSGKRARQNIDVIIGEITPGKFKVLPCKHFGGREHSRLITAFYRNEHGGKPHRRLAAADISLQKAVHHLFAFHIGKNFVYGALLPFRKAERKTRNEFQKLLIRTRIAVDTHLLRAAFYDPERRDQSKILFRSDAVGRFVFFCKTFGIMHFFVAFP